MKPFFDLPFVQVALPIIVAFALATLVQNRLFDVFGKRMDDMRSDFNARFNSIDKRLDKIDDRLLKIDNKLENFGERLVRVEERTSILQS